MADESGSGSDRAAEPGSDPGGSAGIAGGGLGSMSANAPGGYNGPLGSDERSGYAMGPFTGWTTPMGTIPGWASTPFGALLSMVNPALGALAKVGIMGYNAYANSQNAKGSQPMGVGAARGSGFGQGGPGGPGGPGGSPGGGVGRPPMAELLNMRNPALMARLRQLMTMPRPMEGAV